MKIITQLSLFDDTQNENLGDLERLQNVLENLPDEPLIQKLKSIRGNGRNEWPVEAMWNSFTASAYTNFLNNLRECQGELREMFDSLVEYMYENLSDFWEKTTKTKRWFGFRLHLISDATYELPVDFEVTKASNNELKETEKMLENMKENYPGKIEKYKYFLADRGYDSTDFKKVEKTV